MCVVSLCCCCVHPGGADLFSPASLADPPYPRSLLEVRDDLLDSGVRRVSEGEEQTLLCSSSAGGVILDIYTCVCACMSCIDHLGIDPDSPKSSDFSMESGLVMDPGLILVCSVQTNVTRESMKLTECLFLIDQESTQILLIDHLVQRGFTSALGLLVQNKIFPKSDTLWTFSILLIDNQ